MFKKISLSVLIVALVLPLCSLSIFASSASRNFSSDVKNSPAIKDSNVLATVNGKAIKFSDFQEKKKTYALMYKMQKSFIQNNVSQNAQAKVSAPQAEKSDRELLQDSIMTCVILDDCREKNITVSRAEARQAIEKDYAIVQNLIKNGSALEKKQAKESLDAYQFFVKSMGISVDEYNDKYGISIMQTVMLKTKHCQYFVNHLKEKNLTANQVKSLYYDYKQKLYAKSDIKINEALLHSQ